MRRSAAITAVFLVLAAAALWPGRAGGFMLDDFENLAAVHRWVSGETSWFAAVVGNQSGPLGRPLSMASFVLDVALGADTARALKLTNIGIHLLSGVVLTLLLARVFRRLPEAAPMSAPLAAIVAGVWLVLPIHVSTVLYVVQRMTLLSALFGLFALLAYVAGSDRVQAGRGGRWLLFLVFPALTAASVLAKENGLLVPLFAAAIHFAAAPRDDTPAATATQRWFFRVFLVVPGLAAAAVLALKPGIMLDAYATRPFDLEQRLLTETRVLVDYVRATLLPFGPGMGLIHDDYALSTGLLAPPATAASLLALALALAAAPFLRRRRPLIALGILWYLAGHVLESTVFALEIYFEHRNYLPSIGLLLVVTGGILFLRERLPAPTAMFRRTLPVLLVAVVAAYAAATHARAGVWGSPEAVMEQSLAHRPGSLRLRTIAAIQAINEGRAQDGLRHLERAAELSGPGDGHIAALWRLLGHCAAGIAPSPDILEYLLRQSPGVITVAAAKAYELVATKVETGQCPGLDAAMFARVGSRLLQATSQPDSAMEVWRVRYFRARVLASQQHWEEAIAEAEAAFADSQDNAGIGVLLFQLYASNGDDAGCRRTLDRLRKSVGPGDFAARRAVQAFEEHMRSQAADPPAPAATAVEGR